MKATLLVHLVYYSLEKQNSKINLFLKPYWKKNMHIRVFCKNVLKLFSLKIFKDLLKEPEKIKVSKFKGKWSSSNC